MVIVVPDKECLVPGFVIVYADPGEKIHFHYPVYGVGEHHAFLDEFRCKADQVESLEIVSDNMEADGQYLLF